MPVVYCCPIQGGEIYQVNCGVFDIRVGVFVGKVLGQAAFKLAISSRRGWMRSQVIAKK
jgi:hypothetical protein